ncbi:hypothetical protein Bhyg_03273 [Pseudolycoriella hygida]|uniref:Uncharacterized protein n=1 Tax=Pseudolycoriella hygida TaxID=35572 RepID=A0A9Q0ND21_9DIPT|nr:hypothetical protein Bhyg_03273 [Pseudolycoriella hygida]
MLGLLRPTSIRRDWMPRRSNYKWEQQTLQNNPNNGSS